MARKFCGSLILRIGEFLYQLRELIFAIVKEWFFELGINFCDVIFRKSLFIQHSPFFLLHPFFMLHNTVISHSITITVTSCPSEAHVIAEYIFGRYFSVNFLAASTCSAPSQGTFIVLFKLRDVLNK